MGTEFLTLIVGAVVVVGIAAYLYIEHQARILRTRVVNLQSGMRFEAHGFSMEVKRTTKQVVIQTRAGQRAQPPAQGAAGNAQAGPMEATFAAAGLQIEVARNRVEPGALSAGSSSMCTIILRGTEAQTPADKPLPEGHRSVVMVGQVPELVAIRFNDFAARVRVWIEKIEHRLEFERIARARQEEEAAQAAEAEKLRAQTLAGKAADEPLTEAEKEALVTAQIAKWRQAAGFTGTSTEISKDPEGRVAWFIDLANDGRVTLHSDKRTIHSTLRGATIEVVGGEIEIGVRDDYWTEEEPALRYFRVFKGLSSDARRAWKERLELVRASMRNITGSGS